LLFEIETYFFSKVGDGIAEVVLWLYYLSATKFIKNLGGRTISTRAKLFFIFVFSLLVADLPSLPCPGRPDAHH
jgi:hypothetical protein